MTDNGELVDAMHAVEAVGKDILEELRKLNRRVEILDRLNIPPWLLKKKP